MPHHAVRHRQRGRETAVRRTPDYGAVRLAASIEAHPDVKQQRSDARRYAVELLRIVARTLQSGENAAPAPERARRPDHRKRPRRKPVPHRLRDRGTRTTQPQPAPHAGRRRPRRGETADERPRHHVNATASTMHDGTQALAGSSHALPEPARNHRGGSCAREGPRKGAVTSSGRPRAEHYPHGRCSSPSEGVYPIAREARTVS